MASVTFGNQRDLRLAQVQSNLDVAGIGEPIEFQDVRGAGQRCRARRRDLSLLPRLQGVVNGHHGVGSKCAIQLTLRRAVQSSCRRAIPAWTSGR